MALSIKQSFAQKSWAVIDNGLDSSLLLQLKNYAETAYQKGLFQQAKIGRHAQKAKNHDVRTDCILWYDNEFAELSKKLNEIQYLLNQEFYLGINHSEFHYAIYNSGGFYQAHVDQFQHSSNTDGERLISLVLYLNPNWKPTDGGQLQIHDSRQPETILQQIEPTWGRMVLFDSKQVLHSVAPANSQRMSFTGWFRRERVIPFADTH